MTTLETARRDPVSARGRRSIAWRVIYFLGSLKLALLLLATIGIACAIATFCESRFDTKVAQAYIYKAPWFIVWLGVLCVNLFAVTLTRWPWQRKHLGFVITHYGIITLLVGAIIGSRFGFEGNVTLHRGAPAVDRIITSHSVVQIQDPANGQYLVEPFDAQLSRPSEFHPKTIPLPGGQLKILADAQEENLVWGSHLVADESSSGRRGIVMDFATKMMGQHVTLPFLLDPNAPVTRDFFGRAKVTLASTLPKRESIMLPESQLVMAKFAPVIQSSGQVPTGIRFALNADGAILTVTLADGASSQFDRARIQGQLQKVGKATFIVSDYWPDFALAGGKPHSVSDRPNNPAVLVRVEAPRQPRPGEDAQPHLEIMPTADGIAYQLSRGDYEVSRGTAKTGETFPLGWADWTATLSTSLPKARIDSLRTPAVQGEAGVPGFRARLVDANGHAGPPKWIATGDSATLDSGDTTVHLGYGLESRPVPFLIALKNFEVPRLEGTETPANFIATVEFHDPATGKTQEDVARMNHPASWPGTAFALTTGLNYKFSQAQWNPADLGETTLQVLYDPGWLLKWTGSLAICCGIFIMFYLRPKKT